MTEANGAHIYSCAYGHKFTMWFDKLLKLKEWFSTFMVLCNLTVYDFTEVTAIHIICCDM